MGRVHLRTPMKSRIREALFRRRRTNESTTDICRQFGISKSTAYRILREPETRENRRFHTIYPETRGPKRLLSEDDVQQIVQFIDNHGFDGRTVPYAALPAAAGLEIECSGETVRRALKEYKLRFCKACHKKHLSDKAKERRVEYARHMLAEYPTARHWRRVRFSDECHFGWGSQTSIWVLRRPDEKFHPDCIVELDPEPAEEDKKRVHCWAAIGYNFKSELVWYNNPNNSNGKMSLQVYRDQILEPVVKKWLDSGDDFVLEEDNDSGHGTGKKGNIVTTWKKRHNLHHFFNSSQSPDFSPIEKAWNAPKEFVKKRACWNDEQVMELAEEGWASLKQETINKWIDLIPQIFKDCIALEGAMTGH